MKLSRLLAYTLVLLLLSCVSLSAFASYTESPESSLEASDGPSQPSETSPVPFVDDDREVASPSGYMSPDDFFAVYSEDDYTIMPMAVQSSANTPVSSSSGLKGVLFGLFGPYDPPITQLRYQSNTSTNYTYVNDIQPDYPWLCSAGIFAIVLFCLFKMGGALLCRK